MKKHILILLLIALIFRIGISIYDSYGDINIYYIPWVKNINKLGFSDFYSRENTANYPPLTMYLFTYSYNVGNLLSKPIMQSLIYINNQVSFFPSKLILFLNEQKILNSFIKLPFIIADLLLAVGIFQLTRFIIKKNSSRIPLLLFVSMLFNPAFFYNSALWGQIDVLPIMFAIWSIYFLMIKKSGLSAFLFTFGLLSKQTIGVLLPIYCLLFLKYSDWKSIIKSFLLSSVIFFLLFLPFYKNGNVLIFPFIQYFKIATTFGGNALSAHAFNFWWLITNKAHLPDSTIFFNLFPASIWSKIYVGLLSGLIIFTMIKITKKKYILYFLAASLLSMGIFLFSTRMHERHLLPSLPFLLISTLFNPAFYWIYVLTSIIHFFNLYSAWGQPHWVFLWDTLNNKVVANILILFQVGIYFYALFLYLKAFFPKQRIQTKHGNK